MMCWLRTDRRWDRRISHTNGGGLRQQPFLCVRLLVLWPTLVSTEVTERFADVLVWWHTFLSMQMTASVSLSLGLVLLCALAREQSLAITWWSKVTPVHKVTEWLQNLIVKTAEERGAETRVFSEFTNKTHDAITELRHDLDK